MDIAKITAIIKISKQTPQWVLDAREYNKMLDALVNGIDFKELLIKIDNKEDEEQVKARQKYSKSIKDMFERVLRPIDNVYTATGGIKEINIKNQSQKDKFIKEMATIRDGKPLSKWLEKHVGKNLLFTDSNGVVFYEYKDQKLYPTYKNIHTIRNYKSDGQRLDWILFEPKQYDNYTEWRFVDNEKDYIIREHNEDNYTVDKVETFSHTFGSCPSVVISDIQVLGSERRLSPIDNVIELAKEALRDGSHKSMYKFLLWDPIFWRYALKCPRCNGTGMSPDGKSKCTLCDGNKIYVKKDLTDAIIFGLPNDKDQPIVAPNVAGFIVPPVEILEEFNKELQALEDKIYETIWGTINYSKVSMVKTATEIVYNTAPQITRLNTFADTAQWTEWYLTELAANFYMPIKAKDEYTTLIMYGRNYIIEPTYVLLERYEESCKNGSNSAIKDKNLQEWVFSKFKTNPIALEKELKRLKVEPFIHYTAEQVSDLYGSYECKMKMLFDKWWQNEANHDKDVKVLINEFDTYAKANIKVEPIKETEPINN